MKSLHLKTNSTSLGALFDAEICCFVQQTKRGNPPIMFAQGYNYLEKIENRCESTMNFRQSTRQTNEKQTTGKN
jgi:hypothetical protein